MEFDDQRKAVVSDIRDLVIEITCTSITPDKKVMGTPSSNVERLAIAIRYVVSVVKKRAGMVTPGNRPLAAVLCAETELAPNYNGCPSANLQHLVRSGKPAVPRPAPALLVVNLDRIVHTGTRAARRPLGKSTIIVFYVRNLVVDARVTADGRLRAPNKTGPTGRESIAQG